MSISFIDQYNSERTWHAKVLVMEIYHLAMIQLEPTWSLKGTAYYFNCSIGLVSENLKLAQAIHDNNRIRELKTRDQALKKVRSLNGKY